MATTTATAVPSAAPVKDAAYERRWIALLLLSLSLTLIVLDGTIVNIAFPSIRKTFSASFADAEWVNSIYSLIFGAALITWGKLGDTYGRRNIFIAGTVVFVLGSLVSGFAPSIAALVFFRALQGLGGAMMSPSTLSIISSTFKGRERGLAFGVWGATAGVAAALGPIVGGWLIQYGGGLTPDTWRLAFLVNVPVGVLAVVGSFWAIRESRDATAKHHIDWLGILLATLSLGSIVFGAIEGQNYGWLEAKKVFTLGPISYPQLAAGVQAIPEHTASFIPFTFLFGIVLFAIFVFVELRQERHGGEPLFEFGMLRYRSFRYGMMTLLIVSLGEFGVVLALSIFFQLAKGLNAFETGLRFLPFALAMIVAAPLAGIFASRFGAKWIVTTGMVLEAVALFIMSRILYIDTPYPVLLASFLIYGAGVGLAIAQSANIVLSEIPPQKAGVASGATNTIRQIGASLGIALIGAVLFGTFASATKPLIDKSTAFEDFSARVAANKSLSPASRLLGSQFGKFSAQAKASMKAALDNNEGFDNADPLDTAIAQVKSQPLIKGLLKGQGIDLDSDEVVATIKRELAPDVKILSKDLQNTLGEGFSEAGRLAAIVCAFFVTCGALSSLLLPNVKRQVGEDAVVMAH